MRWSYVLGLAALIVSGCDAGGSSSEGSVSELPPRVVVQASNLDGASAAPASSRTVILRVTGMKKSKAGAT